MADRPEDGRGNPRIYDLIKHTPKEGKSPTLWAWPQVVDMFKVAGQPVPGPWPPHQEARPDPPPRGEGAGSTGLANGARQF